VILIQENPGREVGMGNAVITGEKKEEVKSKKPIQCGSWMWQ
jgi:hypothetical protein